MAEALTALGQNYFFYYALILFMVGFYTTLSHSNILKKIIGINIMETSIFLFFVALGYVEGGQAPIMGRGAEGGPYMNPLPSALILTGIVVSVSITAFALALMVKLYHFYGTLDADEIVMLRGERE